MADKKLELTVVVGGQTVQVDANEHAPLHTIIPQALHESGNVGRSPEEWELRDEPGNLLDLQKKIVEFGFTSATRLYLNLKVGVNG